MDCSDRKLDTLILGELRDIARYLCARVIGHGGWLVTKLVRRRGGLLGAGLGCACHISLSLHIQCIQGQAIRKYIRDQCNYTWMCRKLYVKNRHLTGTQLCGPCKCKKLEQCHRLFSKGSEVKTCVQCTEWLLKGWKTHRWQQFIPHPCICPKLHSATKHRQNSTFTMVAYYWYP